MAEPDLNSYSDVPIFNTKAVVQETEVPAATLRAWERRYGVPEPDRTESNYRLYSERDIALIRWLRDRVESGLTISQAVELYRRLAAGEETPMVIPGEPRRVGQAEEVLSWDSLQQRLLEALVNFDERRAEQTMAEAYAAYRIEDIAIRLIEPVMVEIGERWHRGRLAVPVEHFATGYIERKLSALFNMQPINVDAPAIITGCAPRELHQLGVLLFSLFLRRQGFRVLYLGPNVPMVDLQSAVGTLRPAMLALSAATLETASHLVPVGQMVAELPEPRPIFAFGGQAFKRYPGIAERIEGVYLNGNAVEAAHQAVRAFRQHVTARP